MWRSHLHLMFVYHEAQYLSTPEVAFVSSFVRAMRSVTNILPSPLNSSGENRANAVHIMVHSKY